MLRGVKYVKESRGEGGVPPKDGQEITIFPPGPGGREGNWTWHLIVISRFASSASYSSGVTRRNVSSLMLGRHHRAVLVHINEYEKLEGTLRKNWSFN